MKARLDDLKPFESMSYNDLIADMADQYEAEKEPKQPVPDGGESG